MGLLEFSEAQIAALGGAVAAIAYAVITGWRAARGRETVPLDSTPKAPTGTSFLVLDAKQVALLIGEMGALSANLAQLGATMGRFSDAQEQTRRAWERNTEAADNLSRRADELERALGILAIETAREHGRR